MLNQNVLKQDMLNENVLDQEMLNQNSGDCRPPLALLINSHYPLEKPPMRFRSKLLALTIALSAALPVGAAEKAAAPTYTKDIAPIFFSQCVSCHRPKEVAPFSLLTYEDAVKRARLIARLTQSRQMPPWKADKGDVAYLNERHLTTEQIDLIQRWVDAETPEGNKADLPKLPTFADDWPLGKPDLVVKMPKAYKVPAEGRDIYRNFVLPLGLSEEHWVKAVDFRPSASKVVHHTLFFLDTTGGARKKEEAGGEVGFSGSMGSFSRGGAGGRLAGLGSLSGEGGDTSASFSSLGGWAPGAQPHTLPEGLAFHLPKGADLVLSTHFHLSGKVEEEASTVAIYFTDKAPKQRFTGLQLPFGFGIMAGLDLPAGKKDIAIDDSFVLPVDVKAFGVSAHAHYLGKDFQLTATLPDGKKKTLLGISDWDFAWQEQYQFKGFETLPKGTVIKAHITYDNSADNPRNPTSPPKHVRWGKESTDEMGSITLQVVAAQEDDFPKLQDAYKKHIRDSALKSPLLKKLLDKDKE